MCYPSTVERRKRKRTTDIIIIDACTSAADEVKNAVLLNAATDGVSCETAQNIRRVCGFLSGDSYVLAIVDTNHNVKNCQGQLVGGGSATSIGKYVIEDPSLFKLAGATSTGAFLSV